jgi:peptide/nickel transport system ATP-binding protein
LTLLNVESLTTEYRTEAGAIRALDDVSLSLEKMRMLGVVGESGSGKSTLGLSVIRLLPPTGSIVKGRIMLDGKDLVEMSEEEIEEVRGRRIGYVFQDPLTSLNPVKRIKDHFVELITNHEPDTPVELAVERTSELLSQVGISPERMNEYPHQFSGGMRQRIMIGLAVALKPELIIADEPTTALDVIVQAKILDLLNDMQRTYNAAVVLITHNLGIVLERCDTIVVMYAGQVVESGSSDDIYDSPLHPYTRALLETTPNVELNGQTPKAIPGTPPDFLNLPRGCRFEPRCPLASDRCRAGTPELVRVNSGHEVRCFMEGR